MRRGRPWHERAAELLRRRAAQAARARAQPAREAAAARRRNWCWPAGAATRRHRADRAAAGRADCPRLARSRLAEAPLLRCPERAGRAQALAPAGGEQGGTRGARRAVEKAV